LVLHLRVIYTGMNYEEDGIVLKPTTGFSILSASVGLMICDLEGTDHMSRYGSDAWSSWDKNPERRYSVRNIIFLRIYKKARVAGICGLGLTISQTTFIRGFRACSSVIFCRYIFTNENLVVG
jgi:hypothetical protein